MVFSSSKGLSDVSLLKVLERAIFIMISSSSALAIGAFTGTSFFFSGTILALDADFLVGLGLGFFVALPGLLLPLLPAPFLASTGSEIFAVLRKCSVVEKTFFFELSKDADELDLLISLTFGEGIVDLVVMLEVEFVECLRSSLRLARISRDFCDRKLFLI